MMVGIIAVLVIIFLIFMYIVKRIVAGIITVVVVAILFVGGSWFAFNHAVDNIAVIENELVVDLPFIDRFSLPLDDIIRMGVLPPMGDSALYQVVISRINQNDIIVEVPALIFQIPGAFDRLVDALLDLDDLSDFHNDIENGARILGRE